MEHDQDRRADHEPGVSKRKQNNDALCSLLCFLLCTKKVSHFLDAFLYPWSIVGTMATIEVNLQSGRIVQAKGKMNQKISDAAKKHMLAWAAKEKLKISEYL